jgi:hypothetical protein
MKLFSIHLFVATILILCNLGFQGGENLYYGLLGGYRRFEGIYRLHFQVFLKTTRRHNPENHNTVILICLLNEILHNLRYFYIFCRIRNVTNYG